VASIALAVLSLVVLMQASQGLMPAPAGSSDSGSSAVPTQIAALPTATVAPTPTPPLTPNLPLPDESRGSALVKPKPGAEFYHGNPYGSEIYISIDDCSNWARVEGALEVARAKGVELTLFPAGRYIDSDKADAARVLQKAVASGDEIDNHTYSHSYIYGGSLVSAIKADLEAQLGAVRKALGDPYYQEWFVRTPYGSAMGTPHLRTAAAELGLAIVKWSIDSKGYYLGSSVPFVMSNIFDSGFLKAGAIILMHDDYTDMQALPLVIDTIQARGFTVGGVMKKILIDPAATAIVGGSGRPAIAARPEIVMAKEDYAPTV
jgi:peptidoglycan/xylan/chitin deacetylase (PgdA/CDA1 family)